MAWANQVRSRALLLWRLDRLSGEIHLINHITLKMSHTCAWRGACVSTNRDKDTCWL